MRMRGVTWRLSHDGRPRKTRVSQELTADSEACAAGLWFVMQQRYLAVKAGEVHVCPVWISGQRMPGRM